MTEPREVTVSDEEIDDFQYTYLAEVNARLLTPKEAIRQALAAFLAHRMPDVPKTMPEPRAETVDDGYRCGAIDFRDKVLKGV